MNAIFGDPTLLWTILAFAVGTAVGVAGSVLIFARRRRFQEEEHSRLKLELTSQIARVENELALCRQDHRTALEESSDLRQRLLRETELRATYQQAAHRVAELETSRREALDLQEQLRDRISRLLEDRASLQEQLTQERRSSEEKLQHLIHFQDELRSSFQGLAAEALQANNTTFLDLARSTLEKFQLQAQQDLHLRQQSVQALISPLQQTLSNYEQALQQIEQQRREAYSRLTAQAELLHASQARLQLETGKLVRALGQPQVRGRWGEITLKRVVELAGLTEHCDFEVQAQTSGDGTRLRPDMLVHLPAHRTLAIDAKVPLKAYLEAIDCATEDDRLRLLREHGRQVRSHMQKLGSKQYWSQFEESPEFVVLFLPGEAFFSAALEQDPQLIDYGIDQKVIVSTPTTLIALLKSIAYGWQQQRLTENARRVGELGKELHHRLTGMMTHFQDLGKLLQRSLQAYNGTIGALEKRVLVSARKLAQLNFGPDPTGSNDASPLAKRLVGLDEPPEPQTQPPSEQDTADVD